MMEVYRHSPELSVNFYKTTRIHSPEDSTRHGHCTKNLKSNKIILHNVGWQRPLQLIKFTYNVLVNIY
jgi:hypothetical protein